MFKYNLGLKKSLRKERWWIAGATAGIVLVAGFTSQAASLPKASRIAEERISVTTSVKDLGIFTESELKDRIRQDEIKKEMEAERLAEEAAAASLEQEAEDQQRVQEVSAMESNTYEKELLASIIFCEAGNQSFTGQVAVGAVVLNRVRSSSYPDTMEAVVYQSGQFAPAGTGWLDRVRADKGYTESAMRAAEAALAGENPIGECLFFDQGGYGMQIGAHYFH